MAEDAAALQEEETQLDEIRKKLSEADKVRQHSESLRSAIEQGKREIRNLEAESARKKDRARQAAEAARLATEAQVACEASLVTKREHCQKLEQDMVDFLLKQDEEVLKAEQAQNGEQVENGSPASADGAAVQARPPPPLDEAEAPAPPAPPAPPAQ